MLHRRSLSEIIHTNSYTITQENPIISKFTVKEKKVAKRKEKSRVAAQIRRNKESQTLILLQNALPLALPSPSQMLEKSIVIRIAGQVLFLMNTLDQVLGINGWQTIPLVSNNFLTFFMDSTGQIVYVSPNIELLLHHYHWSNLIGMSLSDVIDFKYRWPIIEEIVRMKLFNNPSTSTDSTSFSLSPSIDTSTTCSRTSLSSKLSLRQNSQACNQNPSTCSLFKVWCCTNINHTNSQLKLLILQAVQIKSSVFNSGNSKYECSKPVILSNSSSINLERSISWPMMSNSSRNEPLIHLNSVKIQQEESEVIPDSSKCIYQNMITSTHDHHYNFKSASFEFCQLIGESPKSIVTLNFLDIVHLEDVIKLKSIIDLIIENNDNHIWTPVYRIMCKNGRQCVVKSLAKQYRTTSSNSLILSHLLIKSSQACEHFSTKKTYTRNKTVNPLSKPISLKLENEKAEKISKMKSYITCSSTDSVNLKRKLNQKSGMISCRKYPRLIDRTRRSSVTQENEFMDTTKAQTLSTKSQFFPKDCEFKLEKETLNDDPFLPMNLEKSTNLNKMIWKDPQSPFRNSKSEIIIPHIFKDPLRWNGKCNLSSNRSPSYSLESCVLTSPDSESTDMPLDDQLVWDVNNTFQDNNTLNYWLDEQYQNDIELILPI